MTDSDLRAQYDVTAQDVEGGVNFILKELQRRESRRRETTLVRLT